MEQRKHRSGADDGEVARLKLQESAFGCWLETVCDYLFYLFLFVGMTIGLWRSSGARMYLVCGSLLLFGAIASFVATGWQRHRLAGERPEQLLKISRPRLRRGHTILFCTSGAIPSSSSGAAFSRMPCLSLRFLTLWT